MKMSFGYKTVHWNYSQISKWLNMIGKSLKLIRRREKVIDQQNKVGGATRLSKIGRRHEQVIKNKSEARRSRQK